MFLVVSFSTVFHELDRPTSDPNSPPLLELPLFTPLPPLQNRSLLSIFPFLHFSRWLHLVADGQSWFYLLSAGLLDLSLLPISFLFWWIGEERYIFFLFFRFLGERKKERKSLQPCLTAVPHSWIWFLISFFLHKKGQGVCGACVCGVFRSGGLNLSVCIYIHVDR